MMRIVYRIYLALWTMKNWKTLELVRDELNKEAMLKNSQGRDTALSYNAHRWAGMLNF